ncbi:thiamine phosphate synthase [Cerasicoccus fimbriatus]|uniref:thiamine phosphate synthase n=1 Tax=Cerasicoccus fimbriatus TaxID=3014554 RepID=UPI0022B55922|nr:thiamine phosphate synthase [Cerasicoccus sp. TK19100]
MQSLWPTPPRVYGILDTGYVTPQDWVTKCQALLDGGADIIQLRAKGTTRALRRELLESILPLIALSPTPLVLNDDWELALEYDHIGVHVGQDDTPVAEVRSALGPDRVLGLSTHSPAQADAAIAIAEQLTYFAVGPVFATQTKPDYTPVGLELVSYVAGRKPSLPWFCIGGVSRANAKQVIAAGAEALVAVSDLLCAENTATAVQELRATFA